MGLEVKGFPARSSEMVGLPTVWLPAVVVIEFWGGDDALSASQRFSMGPARARELIEQLTKAIAIAEAVGPEVRT